MNVSNKMITIFVMQSILLQANDNRIAIITPQRQEELLRRSQPSPRFILVHEAQVQALARSHHLHFSFSQDYYQELSRLIQNTIFELEEDDELEINHFFRILDRRIRRAEQKKVEERTQKKIYETRTITKTDCCNNLFHRGCLREAIDIQHKCPACRKPISHYKKSTTYVHPRTVDRELTCCICIDTLKLRKRNSSGEESASKRGHTHFTE